MDESEQIITGYLLGGLSEGEQTALEEKYFNDRELFDRVVQVESDLVDKHARGLLSPETRDRFESHYLAHPKRRDRAKFAAALAAKVDQSNAIAVASPAGAESWWSRLVTSMRGPKLAWAFALVLLLLAGGALWFLIEGRRLRQELAKTETERGAQEQHERELKERVAIEQQRSEQRSAELDRLRAEQQARQPSPTPTVSSAPSFVSLALTIGGVRGVDTGPPTVLVIPAGTQQVRIQLSLGENDYQNYQAELQSAGGKEIFSRQTLQARTNKSGARLALLIPANKFATGDYILTLKGVTQNREVEDVSKSLFHVEKK
jgi:type IV secretory pathway VirB2 component (pilin)